MPYTIDNLTVKQFRKLLRQIERELFMQNSDSCCNGVTLAQCHTLLEIEDKKETVTDLSKSLGLDKSTISRTIDGLVNIGLVDRSIPQENRRISTLKLTCSGEKMCNTINETNDDFFAKTLSSLKESEVKELIRLLQIVSSRMSELRLDETAR